MFLKKGTALFAVFLSMSLGACWAEQNVSLSSDSPLPEYVKVRKQTLQWSNSGEGRTQLRFPSNITAPFQGKIAEILVDQGDFVQRGDILAWIDSPEAARTMASQRGKSPEDTADWAPYFRKVAVRSDSDGFITQSFKKVAAPVEANEPLFVRISQIYAEGIVTEGQEAQVVPGTQAEVSLDAIPGAVFKGHVQSVSSSPEGKSAHIAFDNLPKGLPQGKGLKVEYVVKTKADVIAVPQNTLVQRNGNWFVSLAYEEASPGRWRTREQAVTVGESVQGQVEILSGLKEGEIVEVPSSKSQKPTSTWSSL